MYEAYTRQSLPAKEYRELLGSALCVFSSNNAFIIENILRTDCDSDWYSLIDKTAGNLMDIIKKTICAKCGNEQIAELFNDIVKMRNRIIHGYGITSSSGEQILATKTKVKDGNVQFEITEEYLMSFIKKNEELCNLLYAYREY